MIGIKRTNMTKHIFLAVVLVAGASVANAQGPAIGVKGDLNISSLAVDNADEEKTRLGANAGIFLRTMPDEPLGLQVELLYSAKGANATYSGFFGLLDQNVDFNLNYVELPVLVSFRAAGIVDFQLGGYAGYLLNARVSTSGDLGSASDELDKDNFRSVDFGIAGGVGFNAGPAQIGLRYHHGLTKVTNSDATNTVLGDATNRCLQAYIALGIPGR